ncbi:MAG: nickel pincer cofactor biosynthesis protein LarC [Kiritimatiellia bacterium]|jgi:uncharacterized protein (TIGR00299 family) protein
MKRRMLFLEGASGISGDMVVASLLDLGADRAKLDHALRSLELDGFDYAVTRGHSHGMAGCDFDVRLASDEHDHAHEHGHEHEHEHEHEHAHDHGHHHHHHHHAHEHRNLADVSAVIDRGDMSEAARALAKRIFQIIAEAEAQAHGKPIDEVHFHEVGAIDSIVDIVAAAVCLDDLGIAECVVTGLTEGTGAVRCQHGDLPVPVPAVVNIAARHGIPLRIGSAKGEMVTPTGIAIAAAIRTATALPEAFTIERVGIGLGKRDFGFPNVLRSMVLSTEAATDAEDLWMVETNIDDSTGEQLGLAMETILADGARDVHYVPCFMKKSRPAYLLRVLVGEDRRAAVEAAVFRSTTTIGLRRHRVDRVCLDREMIQVELPFGTVEVKRCRWDGGVLCYPEYESVKRVAEASGVDFKTVFEQAKAGASR